MQSLSFTPGRALLESSPTNRTWSLRFEDEGIAAYLYICDRALGHGDASILDAMLIYNVAALRDAAVAHGDDAQPGDSPSSPSQHKESQTSAAETGNAPPDTAPSSHAETAAPHPAAANAEPERLAAIEWSRDGLQAVFYLDGTAQAMADFSRHISFCRSDFPNFLAEGTERWRSSSHAWDPAAIEHFESTLYA